LLSNNIKVKIHGIIILPVVLYGCETWSLILKEERRLRGNESRVLRKLVGLRGTESRVLRKHVGLRGTRKLVNGRYCTVWSVTVCTAHQILFE